MINFFLPILLCVSFSLSAKETITLAADVWLPYSGQAGTKEGFMVELAREIFKRNNIEVIYKNAPWERVVKEVERGKLDGAVGSNSRDIKSEIGYFPKNEQAVESFDFFTPKDSTWTFNGLDSLNGKNIGVISGYTFGEELDAKLGALKKEGKILYITGENPMESAINLLAKKRIDIFLDNKNVVYYTLKQNKQPKNSFKYAGSNTSKDPRLYIVFSRKIKNGERYAEILSKGMTEIRKDGTLKRILSRYEVNDWK